MSDSDVLTTVVGPEGNWVLPRTLLEPPILETLYPSGTQAQFAESVSFCLPFAQRIFDAKSGLEICVLSVPKDARAIDGTEGVLSHLAQRLDDQNIEPVDLVKKAWKTSEQDDIQPSA